MRFPFVSPSRSLAVAVLLGVLGCASPRMTPIQVADTVAAWKGTCGLLWIISLDPDRPLRIGITDLHGREVDFGDAYVFGSSHLASSFCRTDIPSVREFACSISSADDKPMLGKVEAWYRDQRIGEWQLSSVRNFTTRVFLPAS